MLSTSLQMTIFSAACLAIMASAESGPAQSSPVDFEPVEIDGTRGGRVAIHDVDGDGYNDIVLHTWGDNRGKVGDGEIVWYRYPQWEVNTIASDQHFFGDEIALADMDGDGDPDVLAPKLKPDADHLVPELVWYEHPGYGSLSESNSTPWTEHVIGQPGEHSEIKDLEVHDIDGDGRTDIINRLSHRFVVWYRTDKGWDRKATSIQHREGMLLADVDHDDDYDAILNGFWLENPGGQAGDWARHDIDPRWYEAEYQPEEAERWRDFAVRVQWTDIDGDGQPNLVLSHAEHAGFPVVWYTTDDPKGGPKAWTAQEVSPVDFAHTLKAADFDLDGRIDLFAAGTIHKMSSRFTILMNAGAGDFSRYELPNSGPTYNAKIGDIDNDGDMDILGSHSWTEPPLLLWRNGAVEHRSSRHWRRQQIDGPSQQRILFVEAADFNRDGRMDIAAGSRWYEQTSDWQWTAHEVDPMIENLALVLDVDQDGDPDIIGTSSDAAGRGFVFAENNGRGRFTSHTNFDEVAGDFLQGVVSLQTADGNRWIVLSWHSQNHRTQAFRLPDHPASEPFRLVTLSDASQNEDLSTGDIDGDGDTDLLLGTRWLEQREGGWMAHTLGNLRDLDPDAMPDRNDLVDVDGDGDLDAIVALELGSPVLWFENNDGHGRSWTRHVIATVAGEGFSMDSFDADGDGDVDIVVGEHRSPDEANRVVLLENIDAGTAWRQHLVDRGVGAAIDHHDGTQSVDLDGDGDLDLVSIGWHHRSVWAYENQGGGE